MSKEERKRRNGITPDKEKTKTLAELQAENAELQEEVSEAQAALMELAELIVEGI